MIQMQWVIQEWVVHGVFVSVFMMAAVFAERLIYLWLQQPKEIKTWLRAWRRAPISRELHLSRCAQAGFRSLGALRALAQICLLLGLLGTVTGMMRVFERISWTDGAAMNAVAADLAPLAAPALAGMMGAVAGLYGLWLLRQRAERNLRRLRDGMTP